MTSSRHLSEIKFGIALVAAGVGVLLFSGKSYIALAGLALAFAGLGLLVYVDMLRRREPSIVQAGLILLLAFLFLIDGPLFLIPTVALFASVGVAFGLDKLKRQESRARLR